MANNSFLSTFTRRSRSVSECSEDNNSVDGSVTLDHRIPITRLPRRTRTTSLMEEPESGPAGSLPDASGSPPGSAAIGGKFFYDIDGKVPFSYYERKPELYDLDGKHRYKYFSHLKRLNVSQEKQPLGRMFSVPSPLPSAEGISGLGTKDPENFAYDIDGKFKYQVFDPSQHQFNKMEK